MRVLATFLMLLWAGAAAAASHEDAARTWEGAEVFVTIETPEYRRVVIGGLLRAEYMQRILAGLDPAAPLGVIVHLHGCTFGHRDLAVRRQARFMASLGYVVFLPDSFRRAERSPTCDPERRLRLADAPHRAVRQMRMEELDYAIEQVLAFPWVRADRIFVAGYDEGGDAVLGYTHDAIRGRIAIAASCRFGVDLSRPLPTPIVTARDDPWYNRDDRPEARDMCRRKAGAALYVELAEQDGGLHDALIYGEAQIALWNFLVRASF